MPDYEPGETVMSTEELLLVQDFQVLGVKSFVMESNDAQLQMHLVVNAKKNKTQEPVQVILAFNIQAAMALMNYTEGALTGLFAYLADEASTPEGGAQ